MKNEEMQDLGLELIRIGSALLYGQVDDKIKVGDRISDISERILNEKQPVRNSNIKEVIPHLSKKEKKMAEILANSVLIDKSTAAVLSLRVSNNVVILVENKINNKLVQGIYCASFVNLKKQVVSTINMLKDKKIRIECVSDRLGRLRMNKVKDISSVGNIYRITFGGVRLYKGNLIKRKPILKKG